MTAGGTVDTGTDQATAGRPTPSAPPQGALRGGFRYLTVVDRSGGGLQLSGVSVEITFTPQLRPVRHRLGGGRGG